MTDRIDDQFTGESGETEPLPSGVADAHAPDVESGPVADAAEDDSVDETVDTEFDGWFDRSLEDARAPGSPDPNAPVDPTPSDGAHDASLAAAVDSSDHARPATGLVQRVLRRPTRWAAAPWPTDRIVRVGFTVFSLVLTTAIMMNVVHLNPLRPGQDLIFDNTTPTGGDFGAHVWGPAYLRDELLTSFRFNGWTMDWYGGMPAYRFYMVLPAIAILVLDVFLAYGVAMKLVSILGLLTLPLACWAFGRLADFRYPMPELFAFAGLSFALDESFSIYGGNLKSTMAGEFSFSIALSIGILGLGVLANGLRTGKYRVWASVLIAASCVSHGIVMVAIIVPAAIIFTLVWIDRTRLVYAVTVGVTSLLLLAWWVGPFLLGHEYMTDMKYGPRSEWWEMYFPLTAPLDILITTLAIFGFLFSIVRRHLTGTALGLLGLVLAGGVVLAQDSLPVIGLLWNPRVLPGFYLVRYLLMMIGAIELLSLLWNSIRDRRANAVPSSLASTALAAVPTLAVLVVLGWVFQVLPGGGSEVQAEGEAARYTWGPFTATEDHADAQGDGWSRYNFRGYEGRGEQYTEYHAAVTAMSEIGEDPDLGCGRAMWENHPDNGQYGTTMALMLLPHWTDGCIGSMEGLFFEASGTTPYHFLTTAAMSKQSSNPVRELRYTNNDAAVGVRHLQDLGVRYLMVRSPEAKAEAERQPELMLLRTSAPWDIYQVSASDIVVPLAVQPVVVEGRDGDPRERNLELGTSWFQQRDEWAAMPADDGPDDWQRISVQIDFDRRDGEPGESGRKVDIVTPAEPIRQIALPAVSVSDVVIDDESLSFSVDQVGVPVLVRVGYFPNWQASGAEGPYRIGPNMMVVVPTAQQVDLSYGRSAVDYLTVLLTLGGIALCFVWRRRGDVVHAGPVPALFAPAQPAAPPIAEVGMARTRSTVAETVDAEAVVAPFETSSIEPEVEPGPESRAVTPDDPWMWSKSGVDDGERDDVTHTGEYGGYDDGTRGPPPTSR